MTSYRFATLIGIAALAAFAGCSSQTVGAASHTMGKPPAEGKNVAVADVKPIGQPITLHGTMIEKCPAAGCWFKLRDNTGVIKVDTKNAGFVVVDVPVNTEVTVAGVAKRSGELTLAASGIRY